jgi:hypothetical protein
VRGEEKVMRLLRLTVQRATAWRGKVGKVLAPGGQKAFDLVKLNLLLKEVRIFRCTYYYSYVSCAQFRHPGEEDTRVDGRGEPRVARYRG